jgi:hypothetical protein
VTVIATVKQYAAAVWQSQRRIGAKLGVSLARETKPIRVLGIAESVDFGVLIKLLIDKGVLTNAELDAALAAAEADLYDNEPLEPPTP